MAVKEEERQKQLLDKQAEESLRGKFLKGNPSGKVIIITSWDQDRPKAAADKLHLYSAYALQPLEEGLEIDDTDYWSTQRCLLIGDNEAAVLKKATEINQQTEKTKSKVAKEVARKQRDALQERERKLKQQLKPLHDKMSVFSKNNNGAWDITGKWKISCPYIEAGYTSDSYDGMNMQMEIFVTSSGEGEKELWAKFNLEIIKGIFRFLGQETAETRTAKGKKPAQAPLKRKSEYEEDDYEDSSKLYYSDSEEDEVLDPKFKIPSTSYPSAENPTWRYRYRCRETGEGEIQLSGDKNIYQITFGGVVRERLSGTIRSTYFHEIPFTGVQDWRMPSTKR